MLEKQGLPIRDLDTDQIALLNDTKNGIDINGTFSIDNSTDSNLIGDYQDYEPDDYGNYTYHYPDYETQTNNKYDLFLLTGQAKKEYCLHLFQMKKTQDHIYQWVYTCYCAVWNGMAC